VFRQYAGYGERTSTHSLGQASFQRLCRDCSIVGGTTSALDADLAYMEALRLRASDSMSRWLSASGVLIRIAEQKLVKMDLDAFLLSLPLLAAVKYPMDPAQGALCSLRVPCHRG